MMADSLIWGVLLMMGALLLALPLRPSLAANRQPLPAHLAERRPAPDIAIDASLHLQQGTCFGPWKAARTVLGTGPMPVAGALPAHELWQPPIGVRPWGVKGWYVPHALVIPQGQRVPCALAVHGQLDVHGPALIEGDIRARQSLLLGSGCRVNGNLFSEGDIRIGPGCAIRGLVMAKGHLHLSPGVVIGTPAQPVSVSADVIEVQGPVLIHASVHAHIRADVTQGPPRQPGNPSNLHDKDKA